MLNAGWERYIVQDIVQVGPDMEYSPNRHIQNKKEKVQRQKI